MIRTTEKRFGFKFGNVIFADPHPVTGFDQAHFVSYNDITSDYVKVVNKTPVIDLGQSLDKIMAGFNKTTRNEINKSRRNDQIIFEAASKRWDEFYQMYRQFEASKKRLHSLPLIQSLRAHSVLFLALNDGKPISGIVCYADQKVLRARIICSRRLETDDTELKKIISNSTRGLMYTVCLYGQQQHYERFDLGEINDDPKSPAYSITKFKLSFGGDLIENYHYYKIYNPLLKLLAMIKKVNYF